MIVKKIVELLFQRDSIILPGFGEFMTVPRPAGFISGNRISPPSKSVSFNPSVKANDYVLARYLAEKENISISQGNDLIRTFVQEISEELETRKNLNLTGLGKFILDAQNSLSFLPDPSANFQSSTFGLTATDLEGTSEPEEVTGSEEVVRNTHTRKGKRLWIAALLLVVLGALAVFGYVYQDQVSQTLANLTENVRQKFNPAPRETSQPAEPVLSQPDSEPITTELPADTNPPASTPTETASAPETPKSTPTPVETATPKGSFLIIAGCFSKEANGEKMVKILKVKGFGNAALQGKTSTGLFLVSAGTYASKSEAETALKNARLKNAWILRK